MRFISEHQVLDQRDLIGHDSPFLATVAGTEVTSYGTRSAVPNTGKYGVVMNEPIDRRRFLARGIAGVASAAAFVVVGPEFAAPADAAPVAKGPNLVFDHAFEFDTVGGPPRGWILS